MRTSQLFFSSRSLKLFAVLFMTIDHVGLILYPDIKVLRIIGRLAYPLFAFLIAYGCTKTRSIVMYFLRLIMFAVWMQGIWAIGGLINPEIVPEFSNIFFTLAFGVLAIWVIKRIYSNDGGLVDKVFLAGIAGMLAISICIVGDMLQVNYGFTGVLLIVMFYVMLQVRGNSVLMILAPAVVLVVYYLMHFAFYGFSIQIWACLSIVFIWLFTDRQIKASWLEKYAFYLFYPLHFCVLYSISLLM